MAYKTPGIRRRVFVVMPFGEKEVPKKVQNDAQPAPSDTPLKIDFNEVYKKLLAPALEKAGCQPFRADEEEAAGDIRRDMFFELVTGDIVLADISILNANVFYELGVRHGVAPRGVLCVHAGWSERPFDVAPDRTLRYNGKLFEPERARDNKWEAERLQEVDELSGKIAIAIEKDAQTIASPVYSLVEGLKPADISEVRTQRATYFNNIADDWSQRVKVARKNGQAGSLEYVRFYLSFDNGATWQDQGLTSVRVWDIPEGTEGNKRLEYAVSLKVDPKRQFCTAQHLIQVRAILSWNNPPPANQPNWGPVWGEVQEAIIQVEPFKFFFPHDLFDIAKVKLPLQLADVLDLEVPVPVKKKTLAAAELAVLYKDKGVPAHRFAFKELMQFTAQPVALDPTITALGAGIKLNIDLIDVLFPKDGDISYEELTCIGLHPNLPDTLVGVIKVKKSSGYSGGPCTDGSREFVTWWADFDGNGSFETCLGTSEVRVYDLTVPPQGVHYAVRLPVDLSQYRESCKKGPRLVRIRAILSWNVPVPCANPNQVPTWGNREETVVHIAQIGVTGMPGKIAILGGIPTLYIDDITGLTTADAVFALNNNAPDAAGRPCPFGGGVTAQGAPVIGHSYIVEVSPDGSVWTPVLKDLTVTDQNGNTNPHKANPITNRFTYLPFEQNIIGLLAHWDSAGDALWQVRLTVFDAIGNPVGAPDVHRIQLDNTGPEVSIDIVTGTGNCGKFGVGAVLSGNFVARDLYLGGYSLSVEPAVNDPGEGIPVPSAGNVNTPPAPGLGWTLNTVGMEACGYVIRVGATDRAIIGSQAAEHHASDSAGFCLE